MSLFCLLLCYGLLRWRKRWLEKKSNRRRDSQGESGKRLTAGDDLDDDDFELVMDHNDDDDDEEDPDKLLKWAETNIPNVGDDDEEKK